MTLFSVFLLPSFADVAPPGGTASARREELLVVSADHVGSAYTVFSLSSAAALSFRFTAIFGSV